MPKLVASVTILLAAISQIASVGSKIILEKDWIVVVSRQDEDCLAQINSVFTTIDLAAFAIAPLIAGLLFEFVSYWASAIFICGWNLISMGLQFILLK